MRKRSNDLFGLFMIKKPLAFLNVRRGRMFDNLAAIGKLFDRRVLVQSFAFAFIPNRPARIFHISRRRRRILAFSGVVVSFIVKPHC
jgi:hypothetical protein